MSMKQQLSQKLLQKMSPQQIQLMKLLQVPTVALEQRIKEELESNPALEEGRDDDSQEEYVETDVAGEVDHEEAELEESQEEYLAKEDKELDFSDYMDDEPSYKYEIQNYGRDEEDRRLPISVGPGFHERLEEQLHMQELFEEEQIIGLHLIGSIDDAGYLTRDLDSISDDLVFTQNIEVERKDLERILKIIQTFDPPGVGAKNLQECLLIQLRRKERTVAIRTAEAVLMEHFEAFTKKHYDKIINSLEITEDDLREAILEITKLNPKPGNSGNDAHSSEQIVPDFILTLKDNDFELKLNSRNAPDLKVSRKYASLIEEYNDAKGQTSKEKKDTLMFVKQKLDSAKWFIDAIRQRQNTLLMVMSTLLEHQREYFLSGDETRLKPMILKDIADVIGMDISTISRVANSKYIQTPYGTFLLKEFFSESLSTQDGEEVSTREVKKILQDLIGDEDKRNPLSDQELAEHLREKGYNIARRTVAKYREQLNLPVARLRKEI
jgi:RNA polymerase sigma-54 factor